MNILISTLQRLEKEATAGPWRWNDRSSMCDTHLMTHRGEHVLSGGSEIDDTTVYGKNSDKDLIEFTRNNLPQIIAALEKSEKMKEALERAAAALRPIVRVGIVTEDEEAPGCWGDCALSLDEVNLAIDAHEALTKGEG